MLGCFVIEPLIWEIRGVLLLTCFPACVNYAVHLAKGFIPGERLV